MIVGITGTSGSGKTTLLQCFREAGALVLDCDAIYRELLATDPTLLRAIESRFPGTVTQGELDRKALGELVFTEAKALAELNAITHGAVKNEVLRRLEEKPTHAAIDAIGLLESGLSELCDVTVAVVAPAELRLRRLMSRDGISEDYAKKRINAQHTEDYFRENCRYVLENAGTKEAFCAKCIAFLEKIGMIKT